MSNAGINAPSEAAGAGPSEAAGAGLVPQLAEHNVTYDDLHTAVKVLQAVASLNPKKRCQKSDGTMEIAVTTSTAKAIRIKALPATVQVAWSNTNPRICVLSGRR